MKRFTDDAGHAWVATAAQEETPRHHGRWYLIFHPEDDAARIYPVPEVRWQTAETAARTLRTMSDFELRRRVKSALLRQTAEPVPYAEAEHKAPRERTNVNAG